MVESLAAVRLLTAAVFAYETAAIVEGVHADYRRRSRRMATLSEGCWRAPRRRYALVLMLVFHLWWKAEQKLALVERYKIGLQPLVSVDRSY